MSISKDNQNKNVSNAHNFNPQKDHSSKQINEENIEKLQKICRICLAQGSRNQAFIKPCKCSGSLQCTHESCLLEWVNRMIKRKIQLNQPIDSLHCQICQQTLQLEKGKKFRCRDSNEIRKRLSDYRKILIICIIFILVTIGVIGFLLYCQFANPRLLDEEAGGTVLIVAWVIISLHLLFWIFKFLWTFVIELEMYIKRIAPMKREIVRRIHLQSNVRLVNPSVDHHPNLQNRVQGINNQLQHKNNLRLSYLANNQILNP